MSEKRSRHARLRVLCRRWRDTEGDLISQMSDLLPYPEDVKSRLSKSAILRLSKAFLKAKQLEVELGNSNAVENEVEQLLESQDGFMLAVDHTGLILHATDHIVQVLGFPLHEVVGSNIIEFLHPKDHSDFLKQLRSCKKQDSSSQPPHKSARSDKTTTYSPEINRLNGRNTATGSKDKLPDDSSGYYTCMLELHGGLEFVTRLKYKMVGSGNKTKQTGYISIYVRGTVKHAASQGWLMVAACYPVYLLPSFRLQFYDIVGVCRYNNNQEVTHVEERLNEYFGFNYADYYKNHNHDTDCWHRHDVKQSDYDFFHHCFEDVGTMVTSYKMLTRSGYLFIGVCVYTSVYGPKGERLYFLAVDYILRRERIRIKYWPVRKNVLFLPEVCGLQGKGHVCFPCRLHEVIDTSLPPPSDEENEGSTEPENTMKKTQSMDDDVFANICTASPATPGHIETIDVNTATNPQLFNNQSDLNGCIPASSLESSSQEKCVDGESAVSGKELLDSQSDLDLCLQEFGFEDTGIDDTTVVSQGSFSPVTELGPDQLNLDLSSLDLAMNTLRDATPVNISEDLLGIASGENQGHISLPQIVPLMAPDTNDLGFNLESLDINQVSPAIFNQDSTLSGQQGIIADEASHDIDLLLSGGLDDFLVDTQDGTMDKSSCLIVPNDLNNVNNLEPDLDIGNSVSELTNSNNLMNCSRTIGPVECNNLEPLLDLDTSLGELAHSNSPADPSSCIKPAELSNLESLTPTLNVDTSLCDLINDTDPGVVYVNDMILNPVVSNKGPCYSNESRSCDQSPLLPTEVDLDLAPQGTDQVNTPKKKELRLSCELLSPALSGNGEEEPLANCEDGNIIDLLSNTDFLDLV